MPPTIDPSRPGPLGGRQVPTTQGTWAKVGDKHYRHEGGGEVTYDYNKQKWVTDDGRRFATLSAAQHHVETDR